MKALLCSTGKRNGGLSRPTPAHTRQKSAKESGRILDRPCGVAPAPPIFQKPTAIGWFFFVRSPSVGAAPRACFLSATLAPVAD